MGLYILPAICLLEVQYIPMGFVYGCFVIGAFYFCGYLHNIVHFEGIQTVHDHMYTYVLSKKIYKLYKNQKTLTALSAANFPDVNTAQ